MKASELARRLGGELHSDDVEITGFSLDSGEVIPGSAFLAIKGARVDGHDFAVQVIKEGAALAIVERSISGPHILVSNLIDALADYGRSMRAQYSGPVVAITGSNGKTTTKELTAAAISPLGLILKNFGNQNTEYTSPLIWQRWTPESAAVVVEISMRGPGQIDHLAQIAQPTHGVVTMIGTAHVEKVGNRQGVADAKSELLRALKPDGQAFLWAEDDYYLWLREQTTAPIQTFGFGPDADCRVVGYRALDPGRCSVFLELRGEKHVFELPTVGRHQALNAAAAILVAVNLGVPMADACEAITHTELPPMRMEIRSFHEAVVLFDAYNASPDSTAAAIRTLKELPAEGRRMAVIGEMKELGEASESGHRQVGAELLEADLDAVILYGDETKFIRDEAILTGYPEAKLMDASSLDDVREFLRGSRKGDLVLIKGSRALGLEQALEEK